MVIDIVIAIVVLLVVTAIYFAVRGRGGTPRLNPLAEESRQRYADEWRVIETRFIDHPVEAVQDADQLAVRILQERGVRLEGGRTLPRVLVQARATGRARGGDSLRRAMQRYQAIVDDACGRDVREAAERGRFEVA